MKRFSLRQLVIIAPLLAALIATWHSAVARKERQHAIEHFERCVERNDALNLGGATQILGREFVVGRIADASKQNPNFVFDGGVRFAQLIPDCHDYTRGSGDGYNLCGIGGVVGSSAWSGPAGTRITSLTFEDDTLKIELHGDLLIGSFMCSIPRNAPDVYVLPWPSKSPDPPSHNLHAMIAARHANSMTRIPDGG
ncbi:hypothetical protein Q31b_36340 [Novipirellula aureliae]|uniref:Uncharacterized protein n=1 Tax=Novipirellula aureliae TaxID=2527966 RepID=A0A5C6DWL8_9BACT|nr:hypothetical protein [Novipirellula aureliae]TWU40287.1 hypothetical protein Q31b_36340 [Novipirellula aureliae]